MGEKEKIIGKKPRMKMVARTMSIEEANQIAEKYEAEGYETDIVKRKRGEIAMYEVWISGEPKGLYAKEERRDYL
jgi:hypothetical protein